MSDPKTLQETLTREGARTLVRAHFPSHQGRARNLGELWGLDAPYARAQSLKTATDRIAARCGARHSWFLTHGASQGLLIAALMLGRRDRTLGIAHNTHVAVSRGLVLADLEPRYVPSLRSMPTTEEVIAFLDDAPPPSLLLTTPSYRGECLDLPRVAAHCRRRGVELVVDEVHGTHLVWGPLRDQLALSQACALVIHSPHKYCGALVQGALLHLPERSPWTVEEVDAARALLDTTSQSNLLRVSVEAAILEMSGGSGSSAVTQALAGCERLARTVDDWQSAALHRVRTLADPWKLVLRSEHGSGYAIARALLERGVDHEYADLDEVLLIFSGANDRAELDRVATALAGVRDELAGQPPYCAPPRLPMRDLDLAMRPREAFFFPRRRKTTLKHAEGAIVSEARAFEPPAVRHVDPQWLRTPSPRMPPGVPVLIPGERVGKWHRDCLPGDLEVEVMEEG